MYLYQGTLVNFFFGERYDVVFEIICVRLNHGVLKLQKFCVEDVSHMTQSMLLHVVVYKCF